MTYTIAVTNPGAEPVERIDYIDFSQALDSALRLPVSDGSGILKIMQVCAEFLSASGRAETVSLEWTAEAPKTAGLYRAKQEHVGDFWVEVFFTHDVVEAYGMHAGHIVELDWFSRWLGPFPIPPGGE